ERDRVDWRLTLTVAPTPAALLGGPLLQYPYVRHIHNLIAPAAQEVERTPRQPGLPPLARVYHARLRRGPPGGLHNSDTNPLAGLPALFRVGKVGNHCLWGDPRLPAADDREPQRHARPGRGRRPRIRAALRPTAAGTVAAGMRLCPRDRGIAARRRHPLLLHRYARRPLRRAPAPVRRLRPDPVSGQ